ncbi:MAG: hypothetical protein AB7N71_07160 [Phycisphaerae bacterium]
MTTEIKPKRRFWKIGAAIVAIACVALVGVWWSLTRPAVLQQHLDTWLAAHDLHATHLGDIRMHLFGGLVVKELIVAPVPSPQLTTTSHETKRPPTVSVGTAQLAGTLSALASGNYGACELLLNDVNVNVYQEPLAARDAELDALSLIKPEEMRFPEFPLSSLPDIDCRGARVRVFATDTAKPSLIKQWMLHATGAKTAAGYALDVRQQHRADRPLVRLELDQKKRTLAASFDEMSVEVARGMVPSAQVRSLLEQSDFRGDFAVTRAEMHFPVQADAAQPRQEIAVEIAFNDVVLAFPLEDWSAVRAGDPPKLPPHERFVRLNDVTGTIQLRADPRGASAAELTLVGKARGAAIELEAQAAGEHVFANLGSGESLADALTRHAQRVAIRISGAAIPTPPEYPKLFESRALGHVLADFLERYKPTGYCDVDVVWSNPEDGGTGLQGTINVRDATCRYADFPYPFVDARAKLRIDNGKTYVEEVVGRHGSARARLTGTVFMPEAWSGFDLRIEAIRVPLNQDLYRALPPQFLPLWNSISPLALANADVHLWRPTSTREVGPLMPNVEIEADLLSGSLQLDRTRLTNVNGQVRIADGAVQMDGLIGDYSGSSIHVYGTLASDVDAQIEHVSMPFRAYAYPVEISEALLGDSSRSLTIRGIADIYGIGSTQNVENAQAILKGGTLAISDDVARPWEIEGGSIEKTGGNIQIREFSAKRGGEQLGVHGTIRDTPPTRDLDLALELQSATIGATLRKLLPAYADIIQHELGLGGAGKVSLSIRAEGAESNAGQNLAISGAVAAARAKPQRFPYPLRDIHATFETRDGRFIVSECTARTHDDRLVHVRGEGAIQGDGTIADLQVKTEDMAINDILLQSLPEMLAPFVGKIQSGGTISVALDKLLLERADALQMKGNVAFAHVSLIDSLKATDFTGTATGGIQSSGTGAMSANAKVRISRGKIGQFVVTDGTCDVTRPDDDGWLYIENIRGTFGNGMLSGWVKFKPETGDYLVDLALNNVDLAPLLAKEGDVPSNAGKFSASLQLRGDTADPASRSGTALLQINNIPIRGTPIVEPLDRLSPEKSRTSSDLFERAQARLTIRGSQVQVDEIEMFGRGVRYVGAGAWSLKTNQINLRLFGAKPENWPHVAILTDLLEGVNRELAQFRVTGTIAEPVVTVEALPSVGGAIRTILGD